MSASLPQTLSQAVKAIVARDALPYHEEDLPFGEQEGMIFQKSPTDTCWMFSVLMIPMAVLSCMLWWPLTQQFGQNVASIAVVMWNGFMSLMPY